MNLRTHARLSRVWLVGAVLATAMIGNWRVAASEAIGRPIHVAECQTARAITDHGSLPAPQATSGSASNEDDDARLVPAIFAWDPEVRFVYYRHVSKWM